MKVTICDIFVKLKHCDSISAKKRRIIGDDDEAGISVDFGSPLGGVLFGLEGMLIYCSTGKASHIDKSVCLTRVGEFRKRSRHHLARICDLRHCGCVAAVH